jgi:glycosyltransferase involved in cell wall biosynthesis
MKISLAIIAGNVEHWMPRFLDSFSPLFDQIIVVRAIGNQSPDASLDIARSRGCITAEYHNKPEHTEWPHVDDFAAARNLAFKLADGDYIAWADTDDVYGGTMEEWQALRKRIATERPDVVTLPYVVPEDQLCVLRERILRRDTGTWISPIHESFKVNMEAPRVIVQESPVWHHATHKDRTPNNERNLRILESIPETERTLSHLFHLWQSMRFVGRIEEGVQIAQQALKHPDLGPDEGYELLINIAQVSTNVRAQEQYLLHALNAAPYRREAFGEMVNCKLRLGDPRAALAYAEAMNGLSDPPEYIWNRRGKYYGYLGVQLHGMALRANGRFKEADVREINHLKAQRHPVISLLHATRGRPKIAADARRQWLNRATHPDRVEHLFAFDFNDEQSMPLAVYRHVIQTGNGASVGAWNLAAAASCGDILIQINDDFEPPMGWDVMIEQAFAGKYADSAALKVSDGHRTDDLLCIAVINRARYQQQGFFLHPRFKSVFSDDFHSWSAYKDGIVIDANHIVIEHHHPFFNEGKGWDEVYAIHNSPERYAEGAAIFEELTGIKPRTA